jgi:hypothetical protein
MASVFDDDVLGTAALPPSTTMPLDASMPGPVGWMPPGYAPPDPGDLATPASGPMPGLSVPLTSPASASPSPASPAPAGGSIDLRQILGLLQPQQTSGFNLPAFMSSLGAGLASAGQNWNKPAMAAFASGAGAALQGGQQGNNQQQDAKLKALHAAIAAWKAGDIAAYRQALINLRAAGAPALAPPSGPAVPPDAATPPPDDAASGKSPTGPPRPAPDAIAMARDAIARGAPREAVIKRLREHGIDPSGL